MTGDTLARFAQEPIASDSAQFPLGRPLGTPDSTDAASCQEARPWGLRAMSTLPRKQANSLPAWSYDHQRQMAVDADGIVINELRMDPSAESVSNNDGDEGPNEDWRHDFAPDNPGLPV